MVKVVHANKVTGTSQSVAAYFRETTKGGESTGTALEVFMRSLDRLGEWVSWGLLAMHLDGLQSVV